MTSPAAALDLASVVIVGRPNVGKSLLFNRLLRRRDALVHGAPGMTLDFLRERLPLSNGRTVWLTDTGGVSGEEDEWTALAGAQMRHAAQQADLFLLVVDGRKGLLSGDAELARTLRRRHIPWWLLVNKSEGMEEAVALADFHSLGATAALTLSAKHGNGLDALRQQLAQHFPPLAEEAVAAAATESPPAVAVVGRPNVGKSTLINRLLGDTRLAVSERPGTTRDKVSCELAHASGNIMLIDTAGIRRQRATAEREKLGVAATRRALAQADCAILMLDLAEGVTYQDKRIAALIEEAGCALVLVANKADQLPAAARRSALRQVLAALPPRPAAPAFMISALGRRALPVQQLLTALRRASAAAYLHLPTARLNAILAAALAAQAPKLHGKTRPKLRYAHQGGHRPPCVVIHGNAVSRIDASYRRYLAAAFTREFPLAGNTVKIVFRSDENPYLPQP